MISQQMYVFRYSHQFFRLLLGAEGLRTLWLQAMVLTHRHHMAHSHLTKLGKMNHTIIHQ